MANYADICARFTQTYSYSVLWCVNTPSLLAGVQHEVPDRHHSPITPF